MITYLFTFFGAPSCDRSGGFFGLVPWYQYLQLDGSCNVTSFDPLSAKGIPLILLAVVDDLLRIAGILAVGYVLYGAVLYITSQGSPDQTAKAQNTLINALIGLAISIFAIVFVSFLGSKLGS